MMNDRKGTARQDGLLNRDDSDEGDAWKHAPSREVTNDEGGSSNVARAARRHLQENAPAADPARSEGTFLLESPGFKDGDWLPPAHGAEAISPPLRWSGLPEGTLGLMISLEPRERSADDGDGENGDEGKRVGLPGALWLVVNVPPSPPMLPAGAGMRGPAEGPYPERIGTVLVPYCAPKGEGEHRTYQFVLRAFSRLLDVDGVRANPSDLLIRESSGLLGTAVLRVRYGHADLVSSLL